MVLTEFNEPLWELSKWLGGQDASVALTNYLGFGVIYIYPN